MATFSRKSLVCTVVSSALLLVCSAVVFGCECSERNDFELEFAGSKAVFVGEVIGLDNGKPDAIVTFRADKIWRGEKRETVAVKTNNQGKACGFVFTKGERYLVYAYNENGALRTSICTRTIPAGYAVDDLERLDDAGWSAPVNGLRARLIILPSDKPDSPFCRIFIEMENVSNIMGQKSIRFDPDKLDLQVSDVTNGKSLTISNGPWHGLRPDWQPTLIPVAGSTRFQISFPGLGHRSTDTTIVDMGPMRSWVIPPDGWYVLSSKLKIPGQKGDHPFMDWSGTLELPAVRIPRAK